jgi:hypothetical protein
VNTETKEALKQWMHTYSATKQRKFNGMLPDCRRADGNGFVRQEGKAMLGGIPVPTAWRVLGLRMEERPPDMGISCEYIE